jgi:WhiB family transcriptional regulator, redox-sensing transcriptional regulator
MRATDDLSWADHGICKGHGDLFYPPFAERPQTRIRRETKARQICARCPVQEACLTYGRINHEYGIWGGENEEERVLAGFSLHAPIGTRHLAALRRAASPVAMPLAEITDPTVDDLQDVERWMRDEPAKASASKVSKVSA